jgi:hypothetical protein
LIAALAVRAPAPGDFSREQGDSDQANDEAEMWR